MRERVAQKSLHSMGHRLAILDLQRVVVGTRIIPGEKERSGEVGIWSSQAFRSEQSPARLPHIREG